jgi:cellulose synthase/poly-beta-1,6-N-acetylglucosamine synthase-like glycosyltransferase
VTDPVCSVVVCTRHRAELLARCLVSLTKLDHPSYELIVVDNTPGDREVERLAAESGARYVRESRVGLSRARNTGGRAAEGMIVAFIDDDAVADPSWLRRHAAALEDPSLVATTGRILPVSLDTEAARTYAAAGGEDIGEHAFRVDRSTQDWFEIANFGGLGLGPNMAFRRELFEAGWGFRESLGLGAGILGEEHYAFFMIIRAGHAMAYVPEAIVRHDYPTTMNALRRRQFRILRGSAAYMLMLLVEEPEFRRTILRYMWEAAHGTRRAWRRSAAQQRMASRWKLVAAASAAVPLYLRSVLTNGVGFNSVRLSLPLGEREPQRRSAPR